MLYTQKKSAEGKPRWGNIARRVQKGLDRERTKKQKFGRRHRKRRTAYTRLQTKKHSITYTTASPQVPPSFPFSPTSCYLQEDSIRPQPSAKMSKSLSNSSRTVTDNSTASPRSSVAPSEDLQSVVSDRELPVILAGRLEDELVVQQPSVGGIGEDGPGRELKALGSDARSEPYDPTAPQVPIRDGSEWIQPNWRSVC